MVDKKSPQYMRTAWEDKCCSGKGEIKYERNLTVVGNDAEDVRRAIEKLRLALF
jgi:hypothetical protein